MRTVRTKVYSFEELNDKAQEKAINALSNINVNYNWWESVYEDALNIGIMITGFDIGRGSDCNGKFLRSATEIANKITEEHGDVCETYKTAETFLEEWEALVKKHSDGISIDKVAEGSEYDFDDDADELEEEFKKSILEDYRIILSKEYDYQTTEKAIKETIIANGYEFTKDGKRF